MAILVNIEKPRYSLRKSRSRMIWNAICLGRAEKGNISVRVDNNDPGVVVFSYRGTDILAWNRDTGDIVDIHAGIYDQTPSTRNQRKMARQAIEEFRRVVMES